MQKSNTEISYVEPGSFAESAGLAKGDKIAKIGGHKIHDILEYRYLISEPEVTLEVIKKDGTLEIITIENDYEDLGIEFCQSLIAEAKSCKNKCIFCFIDQLPKGMRKTVYFKDDDTRLSFLQGNYVTLTNVSDDELSRIIAMHISPINISVHTTNPDLRVKMLKNPNAAKIFDTMKLFAAHGIYMNCQIVLCPGYNDKAELDRTITDMASLYPYVLSCSVVPVGLTKCREGLCRLTPFNAQSSLDTINQIEKYQKKFRKEFGINLVYAADEFYINAHLPIPLSSEYDGFPQIENGVGLIASMQEEFDEAIKLVKKREYNRNVAIATGEIAYEFISTLADRLISVCRGLKITVFPIKNDFFGGGVNVTGLVTGSDILREIPDASGFDELLISECMLRSGEDIFLDDITLPELSKKLKVKITPTPNDGYAFIENILGIELDF
jgi:putative radical SAM enzyme (TIGR03279 family)